MLNIELVKTIKDIIVEDVSDDYTQIGGITGSLDYYDMPELHEGKRSPDYPDLRDLKKDRKAEKQYILAALTELFEENKIRVGTLNDVKDGPYLSYWNLSTEEIIKQLDGDWDHYFGPVSWAYHLKPTFDLTEEYARQIGKYQSDKEKFEKELKNSPQRS
jgi:hypothetical protein